ncbi:VOC family protein [Streptomyces sp. TP-A0874]|uniref:VOC family protein n=1 Tax=Streptomyces sp. TP-A0874 TaxID=549819 RepID=UPI000853DE82|nr:VOC family protein [Streptomyces sp. TP-A0874]
MAGAGSRPTICPTLLYTDARAALEQLKRAFRFTEVAVYEGADGVVAHAELAYGNGVVMLGTRSKRGQFAEVMSGAGPTGVYVVVEDVDAHYLHAQASGVEILAPPGDKEYGGRDYLARDLEGNLWSFGTYAPSTPG